MKATLLVLFCLPLFSHAVDQTLKPHAFGEAVVDAVTEKIRSKCILVDDKYLMRRIAAVDTDYGRNSTQGTGGIWKVTPIMIRFVKAMCNVRGRIICNTILHQFSFDITMATMSNMDTPLYSGLMMHTYISFIQQRIPASVRNQAMFWKIFIRKGGNHNYFISKSSTNVSCSAVRMELVFAIDASGSVGGQNFRQTLVFLEKVVKEMQIAPDMTRVAVIRFATSSSISFNLGTYSSVNDTITEIRKIRYTSGGTGTAAAIQLAQNQIFSNARPNVPKVFVLITDGRSNHQHSTIKAADALKNDSITIFTIGIGNVNTYEMNAVASSPSCTHFYYLSSYNEITAIINEIQRDACEVPTQVDINSNPTQNKTNTPDMEVPMPTNNDTKTQNIIVKPDATGTVQNNTKNTTNIKVEVSCGTVTIYASNTFNKPSAAYYTFKAVATDGTAGWIRSPVSKKLYIALISKRRFDLESSLCTKPHYNISFNPPDEGVTIICRENGVDRECTANDIRESFGPLCGEDGVPNPCTEKNILNNKMRFKHPTVSTKYIQCKLTGEMEIVTCPTGTQYSESQAVCGPHVTQIPSGSSLYTGPNPCTKVAIRRRQFYFANPSDQLSFIQCNEWGTAYLVQCPNNTAWSQQAYTCVHHSSTISPSINPCNTSSQIFYHEHPTDRKSFIQCDTSGNAFLINCPSTTVWSQTSLTCVHDSIKLGLIASSQTTASPIFTTVSTPCIDNTFRPHKDKTKYYVCGNGAWTEMMCPDKLVWAQNKGYCDWNSGSSSP